MPTASLKARGSENRLPPLQLSQTEQARRALQHVYAPAPSPDAPLLPQPAGATRSRLGSHQDEMETVIKEFRSGAQSRALLTFAMEEDRAILRNLGKLHYTQHQLQERDGQAGAPQDSQVVARLCKEQLRRFHTTHTEAISTYLPQLYGSYGIYCKHWRNAVADQERALKRLHDLATPYELNPNGPPLKQPLPRECEERMQELVRGGDAHEEAERGVRADTATLLQLFSVAMDAWEPLCRLAERCAREARRVLARSMAPQRRGCSLLAPPFTPRPPSLLVPPSLLAPLPSDCPTRRARPAT